MKKFKQQDIHGNRIENTEKNVFIYLYYSPTRDKYKIITSDWITNLKKTELWCNLIKHKKELFDIFNDLLKDVELEKSHIPHIIAKAKKRGLIYQEVMRGRNNVVFVLGETQEDIDNYEKLR